VPDDGPSRTGAELARAALAKARETAEARRREHEGSAAARRRAETRDANARPARPHNDDPTSFGAAVEELLADRGWEGDAAVAAVTADWESAVGDELAAHCRPASLRAGVLTITAESTAWATQIRLLTAPLMTRIAEAFGEGLVRSVVVHGPTGPSWTHGPRRVPGRGPRDTYG
jgi:predicted nucleic acid-binding Zn ribbon protein